MPGILVADIEANGFVPSRIWMVGILNWETDEFETYAGDDVPDGLLRMADADLLIGHHILGYDIPQIERLTDGMISFNRGRVVDTLLKSRRLMRMAGHSLKAWGAILGLPKMESPNFDVFSPEMIPYCERDVRLNGKVFDHLLALDEQAVLSTVAGIR
jgi:hypothetical protein